MANLTCKDMQIAIGAIVAVRFESLLIRCEVLDVKTAYGNARVFITPSTGAGSQWVDVSRISAYNNETALKLPA